MPSDPMMSRLVTDRDDLTQLRACTSLAYQLPGMILFVDDADGTKTFRAGSPSNRYVTRHVADLRHAIGAAIGQDDLSTVERVLRFPVAGCSSSVVSGTDAVVHLRDGVWKVSSLGTVTYLAVSTQPPSMVTSAAAALDVLAGLEVTVIPDEMLAVLVVAVDVDPAADDPDRLESEVCDVLGPVAFTSP